MALITGAAGGMGQAIARRLGATHDLILANCASGPLDELTAMLRAEGYHVCCALAGDIARADDADALADRLGQTGRLGALVHAGAVSPGNADWRRILAVNLDGTANLMRACLPLVGVGATAVMIASSAGHHVVSNAAVDALLTTPVAAAPLDELARLMPELTGAADEAHWRMAAYGLAKRENIRLAEYHASALGRRGARIVSISPGMIWTPMGRRAADSSPLSQEFLASTPVGRWGTSSDIAALVEFLVSNKAGFLTGCDILIDGGLTAALRHSEHGEA